MKRSFPVAIFSACYTWQYNVLYRYVEQRTCGGLDRADDLVPPFRGRELWVCPDPGSETAFRGQNRMDRWDDLSGAASHGTRGLDCVALGTGGEWAQAQILCAQEGWEKSIGATARTVGDGFGGIQAIMEGTICLISTRQFRTGGGKCSPPASKRPCRWRNWKFNCARKSNSI